MNDAFPEARLLAASSANPELERAKARGKRIIGYFCSYVPEEMIHAAGCVPYRMRATGSRGTTRGDTYFSVLNCSFVRHCFDKALHGEFGFLDGVVFTNGCDHARRLYDNWRDAGKKLGLGPDFLHMLVVPHKVSDTALSRYEAELRTFQAELEGFSGAPIPKESLAQAAVLYNEIRRRLGALQAARRAVPVPVAGSEVLDLSLALTAVPADRALELLTRAEAALAGRTAGGQDDVRVLVTGGCLEDAALFRMMEDAGASVVAENVCFGARHFHRLVDDRKPPLEGIAERTLRHVSCPRMIDDFETRAHALEKTLREFRADAVIAHKLKFCDLWGGETFLLRKEAERLNVPFLALEREVYGGGTGQLATRVQAFVEQVRNRKGRFTEQEGQDHG